MAQTPTSHNCRLNTRMKQNVESAGRYNVEEFNAATEAKTVGNLGPALVLLPGLAEALIEDDTEPDVFCRHMVKTENGWEIDYNLSFSIFYIGNSRQTTVARVTKLQESGEISYDFYQIPYSEIVPRIAAILRERLDTDERWYVAQVNNIQIEGWLEETGVMCLTKQALSLLDDPERSESETDTETNENIRYQHSSSMESEKKRADD